MPPAVHVCGHRLLGMVARAQHATAKHMHGMHMLGAALCSCTCAARRVHRSATLSLKLRAFWPANHWLQYGVAWRRGANLTLVDMFDALVLSQQEDGTISQVRCRRMPCCC